MPTAATLNVQLLDLFKVVVVVVAVVENRLVRNSPKAQVLKWITAEQQWRKQNVLLFCQNPHKTLCFLMHSAFALHTFRRTKHNIKNCI